jgi:ADP-heptose:LPS heptosyltransferase
LLETAGIQSALPPSSSAASDHPCRAQLERASRLLLVRLRSLGDSILTLPLLEAVHAWRPALQVDVAVESPFAPIFQHHPAVHETLIIRNRTLPANEGWNRLQALIEIRKRRYQAVLNLHGGTKSLILTLASGAGLRIGQESFRHSWGYNVKIPASSVVWNRPDLHTVEHQLTLLRWLDIPIPQDLRGELHVTHSAEERIRTRLERAGIVPHRYVLIHPTATLPTKQWNPEKFGQLADYLAKHHFMPVIFTAAPHEAQLLIDIGRSAKERHHYWSDLNLEDLFAVIAACRVFIGNDSGPTHAAAALRRPVVVIWGSSNFQAWHPWGTLHELIRSDLPCMPCPGYVCTAFGIPKCILDIPFGRVSEACDRILVEPPDS